MSEESPPSEREVPYFEIGDRRVFFDGSHNWVVDEIRTRGLDDGTEEKYWGGRCWYPNPKVAFKQVSNGLLEDQDLEGADEILEALQRIEKTIAELSEHIMRPDLEGVNAHELPLPRNQN